MADRRLQRSIVSRCSTPLFYAFSAVLDGQTRAAQTATTKNEESVGAPVAASPPVEEETEKERTHSGGSGRGVASEADPLALPAPALHRLRSKPLHTELRCALQAAMLSMAPGRATVGDVWENLQAAHGTTDLPAGIQDFVMATRQVMNYRLAKLVSSESDRRSAEMVLSMIPGECTSALAPALAPLPLALLSYFDRGCTPPYLVLVTTPRLSPIFRVMGRVCVPKFSRPAEGGGRGAPGPPTRAWQHLPPSAPAAARCSAWQAAEAVAGESARAALQTQLWHGRIR